MDEPRDAESSGTKEAAAVRRERAYWEAHEDLDWVSQESKEEVVGLLPGVTGDVLELCIGSGTFTRAIPSLYSSYTGIDLSGSLLQTLGRRVPAVTPVQGDAQELPFSDDSYDAVLVFAGLHHLPRYERSIAEGYRVLRPGGSFFCFEPNSRAWYRLAIRVLRDFIALYSEDEVVLDAREIVSLLSRAGFEDIQASYLTPRFRPTYLSRMNELLARAMYTASSVGPPALTQSFFSLRGRKPGS